MTSTPVDTSANPWLPEGHTVRIGRSQSVVVRDSGGPPEAPTIVLVHGWMATADLNWGFSYAQLAEHFRVVAFDMHGHGGGSRSRRPFTFSGCADDIVSVLDALRLDRAVVVGYSMGGPIALRLAQRHPDRVAGLVLCATAGSFTRSPLRRAMFTAFGPVAGLTRLLPESRFRREARRRFISRRATGRHQTWISTELAPSNLTALIEAGVALARFTAYPWATELALPVASVVTIDDELVPPKAQRTLACVVDATIFEVAGGHTVCFDRPDAFAPLLVQACQSVTDRPEYLR